MDVLRLTLILLACWVAALVVRPRRSPEEESRPA
jgi:hypothetical protein